MRCKRTKFGYVTFFFLFTTMGKLWREMLKIHLKKVFMKKKIINVLTSFFISYKNDVKIFLKWIVNVYLKHEHDPIMNLVATIAFSYHRNANNYPFNFTSYLFVWTCVVGEYFLFCVTLGEDMKIVGSCSSNSKSKWCADGYTLIGSATQ